MALSTLRFVGPYVIREVLGQGGMGVVYRAENPETGLQVALKTVNLQAPGAVAGLRREVRALARISHPGVVRVVDEGVEHGTPWYAMELLEGVTLRRWGRELPGATAAAPTGSATVGTEGLLAVQSTEGDVWWTRHMDGDAAPAVLVPAQHPPVGALRTVPLAPIVTMMRRLCVPLAYLHGEGIVHRDLKPDNVVVAKGGRPVLVDFGLTAVAPWEESREAFEGTVMLAGTVWYMAPEQARGEPVDARADLYALGCIMYELLTGQLPYPGSSRAEVLKQHAERVAAPPSRACRGVPAALDELVMRLLAKSPRDRVGHADDVAAALERLGADPDPPDGAPKARAYLYRSALHGRDAERRELVDVLHRVRENGRGAIALVEGEAGCGKTRLLMSVAADARRKGMDVIAGETARAEVSVPVQTLRPLLVAVADRCRERGVGTTERLLGARGPVLAMYAPEIARVPGAAGWPAPQELDWEASRRRLCRYLAETLVAMGEGKPLVLVLDDLQWADEVTAELLVSWCRGDGPARAPVALFGSFRSHEETDAVRVTVALPWVRHLALSRLPDEAVGAMASDMLATRPAPAPILDLLRSRAGGNPFVVAESLRAAVAQDFLYRDEVGRWQLRPRSGDLASRVPLPETVEGLVARQIAVLSDGARRMLAAAAVVGGEADTTLLAAVASMMEGDGLAALAELLAREMLVEAGPGRYRLRHEPLRQAAYAELTPDERRRLHCRAAAALEALLDRVGQLPAIARHHELAGEDEAARRTYLRAARRSADRSLLAEAAAQYEAAIRLSAAGSAERTAARLDLAESVLVAAGRPAAAREQLLPALAEAEARGDDALVARTALALARVQSRVGQNDAARSSAERALHLRRARGDRAGEAEALSLLGRIACDQGRLADGEPLLLEGLAILRQLDEPRAEAAVRDNLAFLRFRQGNLDESRLHVEAALAIHRRLGNRPKEGVTLGNLGILLSDSGDPVGAEARYEEALHIAREVGDRTSEANTLSNLAVLICDAGRHAEATPLLLQALAIHREVGNRKNEGHTLHAIGRSHRRQRLVGQAAAYYSEAAAAFRDVGDRRALGTLLPEMAETLAEAGREGDAAACRAELRELVG